MQRSMIILGTLSPMGLYILGGYASVNFIMGELREVVNISIEGDLMGVLFSHRLRPKVK